MRLHGTPAQIITEVKRTHPDVEDALDNVERRIARKPRREIERYQAAVLYALARQFNFEGTRILEIGTAVGYSAAVMASAAPKAQIVTLNPDVDEAARARSNLQHWRNVEVVTKKSMAYLMEHAAETWHMVFVDGDHQRVRLDLAYWDNVADGGLLVLHDWSPEGTWRACVPVYEAACDFSSWLGKTDVEIVDDRGVGMIGFARQPNDPKWNEANDVPVKVLQAAMEHTIQPATRLIRLWHVCRTVQDVPGALVAMGAGEGGAAALMAHGAGIGKRDVWLFDSFEGMPKPAHQDGDRAMAKWEAKQAAGQAWMQFPEETARAVWESLNTGGGVVKGMVERTAAEMAETIGQIAVLHLDLDWYSATTVALDALYDRMTPGGVVIADDYGHWQGSRQAIDDFRKRRGITAPLRTMDYAVRWWRVSASR